MRRKSPSNQDDRRRSPRQSRALEKIELMFEAAIRILDDEGLAALTTNRIAARAGVSIGTLYQYFPDKESLIGALARRELEWTFDRLRQALAERPDQTAQSDAQRISAAVSIMLGALGGRTKARRQLLLAIARSGHLEIFDEQIQALTGQLLQHTPAPHAPDENDETEHKIAAFVIGRAVTGALRAAVLHDDQLLRHPAFKASLVRLLLGYFAADPRAHPVTASQGDSGSAGLNATSQR